MYDVCRNTRVLRDGRQTMMTEMRRIQRTQRIPRTGIKTSLRMIEKPRTETEIRTGTKTGRIRTE